MFEVLRDVTPCSNLKTSVSMKCWSWRSWEKRKSSFEQL